MKKILAIFVIAITVAVTAYNIYQNLPQFSVKVQSSERHNQKFSWLEDSNAKVMVAVYITFNIFCLGYLGIKYWIWKKDAGPHDSFYDDVIDSYDFLPEIVFYAFCFVNVFVIFSLISWFIYLII